MLNKLISHLSSDKSDQYQYRYFNCKDTDIDRIFQTNYLELAHISLIWKITNSDIRCYLHAPNFWRKRGFTSISNNTFSLDKYNWSRLSLHENSFYPIGIGDDYSLLSTIAGNTHLLSDNDEIIVKMNIKKRVGNWRSEELDKYEHFLEGNSFAVSNRIFRKLSEYINSKQDEEIHNHIYSSIEEIEQKIINDQYRFECTIGISSANKAQYNELSNLIHYATDDISGLNSFDIESVMSIDQPFNHKDYLCKTEIQSLIRINDSINITKNIIENIQIEQESVQSPTEINNIFDFLPRSKQDKHEEDSYKNIDTDIKNTLKRVGVIKDTKLMNTDNVLNGLSFVRCQFSIPEDLVYSNIEKKHKDIRVALGVPSLTIEQGDKPDTIAFLIPKKDRKAVYLGDILNNPNNYKELSSLEIPFFIGVDPIGNPIFVSLTELVHLLIAGETGGGKSVWMNQAILTMMMLMSPKQLELHLIDPKQVEFSQFKDFPHVYSLITNPKHATHLLDKLTLKMEERYELFSRANVKNIKSYNLKNPNKPLPYVVCIVDEFYDLKMTNEDVNEYIQRLSQKARGAGIHLIIATQKPSVEVIDGEIKDNLPSKISFKLLSNKSYSTVFGTGIPFELLGSGHGAMKLKGQIKDFEQFQGAVISLNDIEEEKTYKNIIKYIKKHGYTTNTIESENEISSSGELDQLSKLKTIIANTGETRSRPLQKEMKITQNAVTELLKKLVEEGWLNKLDGNKGYELVADEDELSKWRDE